LPATFAHVARNLSDQPFRNVTIEYLQDEKLRAHAKETIARLDETRGLDVLDRGTKEILFVNDGVRATKFELQPGGIVPLHHHAGPHLLIAVTDLDLKSEDLRSDEKGKAPESVHLKSGDSQWIEAGATHTVTNVAKTPAKYVTLEFP
jgi:quercetin dioxygenase-like cupin family protein